MFRAEYQGKIYTSFYGNFENSHSLNVFFHGFPCETGNRNHDIASNITSRNSSSFILHYEGLGQSCGSFSFYKSIEDSLKITESIIHKYKFKNINLIGHSWGGLIAVNAAEKFNALMKNLILVSPYLFLPKSTEIINLAKQLKSDLPHLFLNKSSVEIANEINEVKKYYDPLKASYLQKQENNINIIHAINDEVISPSLIENFIAAPAHKHIKLKFLNQQHSFLENRVELITEITRLL